MAVRDRWLHRHRIEIRSALSAKSPLESHELRHRDAATGGARPRLGVESSVRQRRRDEPGDLDIWTDYRRTRRCAAHHSHVRVELFDTQRRTCDAAWSTCDAGDRADHWTNVSAVRLLHDH